jgi:hypothetical protein
MPKLDYNYKLSFWSNLFYETKYLFYLILDYLTLSSQNIKKLHYKYDTSKNKRKSHYLFNFLKLQENPSKLSYLKPYDFLAIKKDNTILIYPLIFSNKTK